MNFTVREISSLFPSTTFWNITLTGRSFQEYTSTRVADVYEESDGTIGSPTGTIRDGEDLKEYFLHLVRTTKPPIHCELLSVLRGNGSVAVVYERENSVIVAEYMKVEYGRIVRVDVLYSTPESP